ncbi:MAG TPA: GNAT family N-acetyltransferase [Pseudonocardiaceae bacterium]
MPSLVLPDQRYRRSFLAAMAEFRAEGRGAEDDNSTTGSELRQWPGVWDSAAGFADYLAVLRNEADPNGTWPPGYVQCTTWWWVDGDEYLGRIALRHTLTDRLRAHGGHIGYDVRPTARRRGYATAMLREVLPLALAFGITPAALLTCDSINVASRKVIETIGGVLADDVDGQRRYWIPTG